MNFTSSHTRSLFKKEKEGCIDYFFHSTRFDVFHFTYNDQLPATK